MAEETTRQVAIFLLCSAILAAVPYGRERASLRVGPTLPDGAPRQPTVAAAGPQTRGGAALERLAAPKPQLAMREEQAGAATRAQRAPAQAAGYAARLWQAAQAKARAPRLPAAPADVAANRSAMRAWCEASTPPSARVSCARAPPCALNEVKDSILNARDCAARKRYAEWPTADPYLAGLGEEDSRVAQLVERLGNRTMLIAGDSVSNLDFRGLLCALHREELFDPERTRRGVARWRAFSNEHELSCCRQVAGTVLGGTVVFVGVYRYEPGVVSLLLRSADVLLLNYGLHYRHTSFSGYVAALRSLFEQIVAHQAAERRRLGSGGAGTRVLFRETSAQHFKGTGSYTAGAERIGSGGCACAAHTGAVASENHVAMENAAAAQLAANVTGGAVPIVPFYKLTAPRYDMHNRDDSCGGGASRRGAPRRQAGCCDCTHFCYTPQLYDAYFANVERALARADRRALALAARRRTGRRRMEQQRRQLI